MLAQQDELFPFNKGQLKDESFDDKLYDHVDKYDVLLVEDNTDDRLLALRALSKSPYIEDIRFFRNGEDLIEYFVSEGYYSGNLMCYMPTLILLDIHMPGQSGIKILRKIKEHPATHDIPVVMVTCDPSDEMLGKARQYKANAFVTKPLDLESIHNVINTGWGWPEGLPPEDE